MKHANGTEYALCPKVATDIDTFKQRFRQLIPMDCGRPWDEEAYAFWGWDELRQQLQSPVAYEPSEEDVERVARAIDDVAHDFHDDLPRAIARAAIRAFLGDE